MLFECVNVLSDGAGCDSEFHRREIYAASASHRLEGANGGKRGAFHCRALDMGVRAGRDFSRTKAYLSERRMISQKLNTRLDSNSMGTSCAPATDLGRFRRSPQVPEKHSKKGWKHATVF